MGTSKNKEPLLKQTLTRWLADESGQSTTEYVLLVLMLVIAVRTVGKSFQKKLGDLTDVIFSRAEEEARDAGR